MLQYRRRRKNCPYAMRLDQGTLLYPRTGSNLKPKPASKQYSSSTLWLHKAPDTLFVVSSNGSLRLCQKHPTAVTLHLPSNTQDHILVHS